MPRRPRVDDPAIPHHVTTRGNDRRPIFLDDRDRRDFLHRLIQLRDGLSWRIHTYCLMRNHYHLLLETQRRDLSEGIRRLNSGYAARFNKRHGLTGHLFGGRFHSTPVTNEHYLSEVSAYIALNPVRAGLCQRAAEWPWSGHRAVTTGRSDGVIEAGLLAERLGASPGDGLSRYLSAIETATTRSQPSESGDPSAHGELKERLIRAADLEGEIAKAYSEDRWSLRDLAAALDCHPSTVLRRIRQARAHGAGFG